MNTQHRYCKDIFNRNGYRSDRNLFGEDKKDEALAPPLSAGEIPYGYESVPGEFLCQTHDVVAVGSPLFKFLSVIMTLAALCLGLLKRTTDVPYTKLTENWWLVVAATFCLSIFNLRMFCGTAPYRNNIVLLAAQFLTRSLWISLAVNIQEVINGEWDKDEYIMAFLCFVQDVIYISTFIISLCGGDGDDDDDDDD